ncbi:MAG: transposase [Chitinophagales bacterium]|nr:transposase [Chitinophagales bacterium]
MAFAHQFHNSYGVHFVTCTTVQWVDVFTRSRYSDIVVESLNHCIKQKGLNLNAWVIMTNHLHLIISRNGEHTPSDIMKDFKKYTSTQIIQSIQLEPESRQSWMTWIFASAGKENANNRNYQFWQQENHPVELFTPEFALQKINYLHLNPVRAGFVSKPEDWMYSSAQDYAGEKGKIPISFLI